MKKQPIKINEATLRKIVSESVRRVLKEEANTDEIRARMDDLATEFGFDRAEVLPQSNGDVVVRLHGDATNKILNGAEHPTEKDANQKPVKLRDKLNGTPGNRPLGSRPEYHTSEKFVQGKF